MDKQQVTIHAPDQGSAASQRYSGFAALDAEARATSFRNLAAAAYVYAGVYFVAFTTGWLVSSQTVDHVHLRPATAISIAGASIVIALVVARLTQTHKISRSRFSFTAQLFMILSCLGIAAGAWGWQFQVDDAGHAGVHWVGVWIISFAATITLPPRTTLIAGIVSSLTIPLIGVLSAYFLGFPPAFEETGWVLTRDICVAIIIPVWICVGIATVISARVFHLEKGASNARRLGSYQLKEKLGEGGMGEVWRASHRMLARPAAIKLIREQNLRSNSGESASTVLRRFEREAQATAALTSPHTIQIYDFGITGEHTFYYVMELLHGMDLHTLVEKTGPVPASRALHFLRQACDSLADAHAHGMVHRDIKPANLFTCRQGLTCDFLKLLDFGLVKEAGRGRPSADVAITQQGMASGTPGYMAPEMATQPHSIDGRADLYALGCVGFWLLTGDHVFSADTPLALLLKHVNEPPASLNASSELVIPDVVEQIIADCLAKSASDRPSSAQELGDRIRAAQAVVGEWTLEQSRSWWELHVTDLVPEPSAAAATQSWVRPE